MKLRNFNGAIRKTEDKIRFRWTAPDGRVVVFMSNKSDAVKALTEAFPEGGMHETGIMVSETGELVLEGTPLAPPVEDASDDRYTPPGPGDEDDDDTTTPPPGYGHFSGGPSVHDINVERFCGHSAASLLDDDDDDVPAPAPKVSAASLLDDD